MHEYESVEVLGGFPERLAARVIEILPMMFDANMVPRSPSDRRAPEFARGLSGACIGSVAIPIKRCGFCLTSLAI